MKNINLTSPIKRDELLSMNIGKYNQIKERLIYPIGEYCNIYNIKPIKNGNIGMDGLLDYTNNTPIVKKTGEFEKDIEIPNSFNRNTISIDLGYDNVKGQKYSYVDGFEYNDPKDKNWLSMGVQSVIGYVMGDSVGIGINNNGVEVASTSLETATSLFGRLAELGAGIIGIGDKNSNSDLSKIGMRSLSTQFANSVIQKTRINEGIDIFFKKPIGFYDSIDTLDLEKLGNTSGLSGIFDVTSKIIPMYFYTEVKKDKTSAYKDGEKKEYSWKNNSGLIDENDTVDNSMILSSQSLLYKTQKLFQNGKIETMITDVKKSSINGDSDISNDNKLSRGRNLNSGCRVWTVTNKYNRLNSLIRPFSKENADKLKKTLNRVRPGFSSLENYGVLQDNGFVNMAPYWDDDFSSKKDQRNVKKYMFSIENLAWKDSIDSIIEGTSQEGPNGGRIMWFPPYDISFNETTTVNWTNDVFIGRGEPIYTYSNTERNGTLNFKVIVDHPSIINYYKQSGKKLDGKDINEDDYLNFFAGCDVLELTGNTNPDNQIASPNKDKPLNEPKTITFKVFFPNNYSGVEDGMDTLLYLASGTSCNFTGGSGYENKDGIGLTPSNATIPCSGSTYFYRVDKEQNLNDGEFESTNKKDTTSFGLNSRKDNPLDPNSYSFIEAYNFINNKYDSINNDNIVKTNKKKYILQYILFNDLNIELQKNPTSKELQKQYDDEKAKLNEYKKEDSGGAISNDRIKSMIEIYINPDTGKSVSNYDYIMSKIQNNLSKYEIQLQIVNSFLFTYLNNKTTVNEEALESSRLILNSIASLLAENTNELISTDNEATYNDFYQTLKDATKIAIYGSASKHGKKEDNEKLSDNRAELITKWLKKHNDKSYYEKKSVYNLAPDLPNKDVNSKDAKSSRFAYVIITTDNNIDIEKEVNKIGYSTSESDDIIEVVRQNRKIKSMYGYYDSGTGKNSPNDKLKNDESMFFEKIKDTSIGDIINGKLSEKIRYFHPAFHSTTPEGFNSRLTFLHQCTRQGPTSEATSLDNNKRSATNMAFGRPPVCILRIGDFYNTKVVFDTLNIEFDPLVWDLNQEGIGVQPMIATVSMNFKFIGGSDLTGPIARLQNAITFNFFANTGVYDDRNDRIKNDNNEYDKLYRPHSYETTVKKSKTNEDIT